MTFRPQKKPALTLDASLVQDDLPLEVIPKVFIGSIHSAFNSESLHHNGITHILNASRLPITFPKLFTYLSVEIRDRDSSNILACIPTTNIFIEAGLEHGGVLVHCFGGKSRSAAFVCAYIMSSLSWSFDEAYATLKAARPIVEINAGFECQLRAYHAAGCDVYLAQQLLLRTRIRQLHQQRGAGAKGDGERDKKSSLRDSAADGAQEKASLDSRTAHTSSGCGSAQRGLFADTKESAVTLSSSSAAEDSEGMDVVGDAPGLLAASASGVDGPGLGIASLSVDSGISLSSSVSGIHSSDEPKYDSFYYQRDHHLLPEGKPTISFSKLTTQVEEPHDTEFTFSKTRSISDVYEDSRDPCLDGAAHHGGLDPREEEERATYDMLQRKLHYVADSPSGAALQQPLTSAGSLLPSFAALSTSSSSLASTSAAVAPAGGFTGLGGLSGLSALSGLGAGLSIGLSIGTQDSPSPMEGFHQPTRSIGAGFMQGSGNSAGNRTHRAGMQNNRNKGGRKGRGGGSSSSSSSEVDSAPPACRLSRPGSTIVRVIPPLRGLERQFRCSWCNTALFTTANVLRTDLDLRPLLENFAVQVPSVQQQQQQGSGAKTERHSVEEYLAQEKARLGRHNDHYAAEAKQEHTPPKVSPSHPHAQLQSQGETSPLSARLAEHKEGEISPRLLPLIRANSGNMAPNSARGAEAKGGVFAAPVGSKEDPVDPSASAGAGRFPPIALNRSNASSRSNSASNLTLLRGPSGGNLLQSNSADNSTAAEMDIDSSPPRHDMFAPPMHRRFGGGSSANGGGGGGFGGDHDSDHENEIMAAPKFPMGGLKTSKAGNSKAFDFDLPMDTVEPSSAGYNSGAEGNASSMALVPEESAESGGSFKLGIAAVRRASRDDAVLLEASTDSRRNSAGQLLPMLLHSKTTPTNGSQRVNYNYADASTTYSPANTSSQKGSPRAENLPLNPARGLNNLNVSVGAVGIAGMSTMHAPASNSATFLHGISASAAGSPHSTTSSARSDDSPSPRVHIPPHRLQQQQLQQQSQSTGALPSASPRSLAYFQQYPRPQSAEKRRWLARMNLLRQGGANPSAPNVYDGIPGDGMLVDGSGTGSNYVGDHKVARMAEADDVASQLVYGGPEKYFHVEYLEWMGPAVLQEGVEGGDICCVSCKNVLGGWMWNPSNRLTMGGKLEAPLFRIHKHVVHQADVQFDATPSSTPRLDEHRKTIEGSPQIPLP